MTLKELCLKYFKKQDGSADQWVCKCGKTLKQKPSTGWSNLANHIRAQHPEAEQVAENQLRITDTDLIKSNKKAINIYSWLDWVITEMKPFSFVDSELTRKYTNLSPICRNTFTKYMESVTIEVEKKIAKVLLKIAKIVADTM